MLKGSEMVIMGPPLTLISIVKPKRGVGSHVEKGGTHRVPPRPTEPDLGPTRPTEPNLGPTVEKSSDPPGPTKYVSGHVQGWWF